MFSIVIPTLQKDNQVLNLLIDELTECKYVGEIIVIDNSRKGFAASDKVRVIIPEENLYVNPAWNLGVSESRYEFVGILNDDIIFPKNSFEQIHDFLLKHQLGLLGLDSIKRCEKDKILEYPEGGEVKFSHVDVRDNCWGSAIFGRKENFCHIPDDIKIWCGDDFLFKKNVSLQNYKMHGVNIKHLHSNTSSMKEFDEIKQNDVRLYQEIDPELFRQYTNKKNKFDLFVSLGAACSCTQTLREHHLQYASHPFDWLYGSNFLGRVNILLEDFQFWLNKEDLEYVGKREFPLPCNIYKNLKTGIVFNHDFPLNISLDESFFKVKEKYNRRIARLLNQINTSKSVLFVYIERPDVREEVLQKDLIKAYELLQNKYPNTDINILYLFSTREVDFPNRKVVKVSDNIFRVSFDYCANLDGHAYVADNKLLKNLFKTYKISGKHLSLKQKLGKIFKRK